MESRPGTTCIDIKKNGKNTNNGVYYIKGSKKVMKVYCDMTSDGGGWTLMFAYTHHPLEEYEINDTEFPTDPENSKSHMALTEAGLGPFDATEFRFFCASNDGPKFMHFKSNDPSLVQVALSEDQSGLNARSIKTSLTNLDIPKNTKFLNLVRSKFPADMTITGKKKKGGFWDSPFEGEEDAWSVKTTMAKGKWECGKKLDLVTGSKYETIHQIWFRGPPPPIEFVRTRAMESVVNNIKD